MSYLDGISEQIAVENAIEQQRVVIGDDAAAWQGALSSMPGLAAFAPTAAPPPPPPAEAAAWQGALSSMPGLAAFAPVAPPPPPPAPTPAQVNSWVSPMVTSMPGLAAFAPVPAAAAEPAAAPAPKSKANAAEIMTKVQNIVTPLASALTTAFAPGAPKDKQHTLPAVAPEPPTNVWKWVLIAGAGVAGLGVLALLVRRR